MEVIVPVPVRCLAIGLLLGGAMLAGGAASAPAAAQACDPSYPEVCVAAYPDLDCIDIGYPVTVYHDPVIGAYDPHGLDADYDGIGCESS
jgi:hypothetical protein